jgi:hypothetical protein
MDKTSFDNVYGAPQTGTTITLTEWGPEECYQYSGTIETILATNTADDVSSYNECGQSGAPQD